MAIVVVRMEAVYDSPTSAEEKRIAAPTALMVVSARGFVSGFYVSLCGVAGWKEWLRERKGRWLFS